MTETLTISELNKLNKWPYDWTSIRGILPYIKRLPGKITGLEIGTCRAESTILMIEACDNIEKLYTIDAWKEFQDWNGKISQGICDKDKAIAFQNNAEHGQNKIEILDGHSYDFASKFADESLDFIFIDGDHSYEGALRDMNLFYPKLKDRGLWICHDWHLDSVNKAAMEFRRSNKISIPIMKSDNSTFFWYKR